MARVLVTGATTGLGLGAAETMIGDGHDVILHARNPMRARDVEPVAARAAGVVVGDLADRDDTVRLADAVNALGPLDAVIHNAAVYAERTRGATAQGHPRVLAVNVLAPYVLTALIERPGRLIYLSSGMHTGGSVELDDDLEWNTRRWNGTQAYCDSKLYVTALAMAIARHWPDVASNAVDPGWVPTRMGGPSAPDDLHLGHRTQVWLATSDDPTATSSGGYWYHQRTVTPAAAASDPAFQDQLVERLTAVTGYSLPPAEASEAKPTRKRVPGRE